MVIIIFAGLAIFGVLLILFVLAGDWLAKRRLARAAPVQANWWEAKGPSA